MFKIKLIKGRSYIGNGVKVYAEKPFAEVKTKEQAEILVATGRFTLIGELATTNEAEGGTPAGDEKPVEKMTEKELDAYAVENGIDLVGLTKKADKLARIQEVLATAADGNIPDFGEDE